jgi:hypothetical protein
MRRTSQCRLFLTLCILVVGSAAAALAAEQQCSAPSYFSPLATTAEIEGVGTQSPALGPKEINPARSQSRPADCTYSNFQHQSNTHTETSSVSCDDAASKIAADADADARNGCCNLGGSVWYESAVQRSNCLVIKTHPPSYELGGYIFYKCQFCDPATC